MITAIPTRLDVEPSPATATARTRSRRTSWWLVYVTVLCGGLAIGAIAYKRSYQPYFGPALACLVLLLAAWIWVPRAALAVTVALTLTGDLVTVSWFPFAKNLSSWESIMYLADGISVSPLEITIVWALAVTAYRNLASSGPPLRSAPLVAPLMIFTGLALFGLARGLSRGGDTRAAILEIRPLLLLPLLYVLVVNVCRSRSDYRSVYWAALGGIVVQSLLSLHYLGGLPRATRDALGSLNEHGSAIGMNLLLVFLIASLAYSKVPTRVRVVLVLAVVPVTWVYLVAQRRSAVVALCVGLVFFAVTLSRRQRRTFWKVIPVMTIVTVGYLGAMWNSDSSAGFPAQAVKSVIAPQDASEEDQSSDLYRQLEKLNLNATIRAAPVLGIGFGHAFHRPYALPDISVFELEAYIPHNSLLWIWTKMGFGGFVAMLYVLGRAVTEGATRARTAPAGVDAVVALAAVAFIAMYTVFLYVDIAWEPRNVVLLALAFGLCTGPLNDDDVQRVGSRRSNDATHSGTTAGLSAATSRRSASA